MAGNSRRHYDVAVVGAAIVGLAHAVAARRRGLSVVASPFADVRVVSVTTGIGMTTGPGLAERVVDDLYSSTRTEGLSGPTISLYAR